MSTPTHYDVDLSRFHAPSNIEPILPYRRPDLLPFIIANYILFCVYTYMLLTQIAKRNRVRRRAQNGKKNLSVDFEEEVLIVRVPRQPSEELKLSEGEDVEKERLKS